MSELMLNQNLISAHNVHTEKSQHSNNQVDVMALVFYYLVQAATTSSESALIKAKQLSANAAEQEALNKKAEQLHWYSIPRAEISHHSKEIRHTHWTWRPWDEPHLKHWNWKYGNGAHRPWNFPFVFWTYKKITWTVIKNQGVIDSAESKNQNLIAERQALSQKMGLSQENAQRQETQVNSITDEAAQSLQVGTKLMQIIQSMTFDALMRDPVRG